MPLSEHMLPRTLMIAYMKAQDSSENASYHIPEHSRSMSSLRMLELSMQWNFGLEDITQQGI